MKEGVIANILYEFISSKIFHLLKRTMNMFEYWFSPHPERPMMKFISQQSTNKELIGAEIGTYKGSNSFNMLSHMPNLKMLYLIDPYQFYSEYSDKNDDIVNTSSNLDDAYQFAKNKLNKFENRICFIRKDSEDAASDVPNKLDFVYIDGNHSYEYVKKDIEIYYPKVKVGGVIGGHDFDLSFPGVPKAVFEFADKYNLKIHGRKYDWWVVKEK